MTHLGIHMQTNIQTNSSPQTGSVFHHLKHLNDLQSFYSNDLRTDKLRVKHLEDGAPLISGAAQDHDITELKPELSPRL